VNSPATAPLPPGYTALELERGTAVVLDALANPLASALRAGSFYGYAAAQPAARVLRGRGAAYAVPLPDGVTRVVVRRSRHGGLFAPITGDRFFGRTRAPHELDVALRLAHAGVPTPQLLAYAIYPAGPFTSRADVVTREVPDSADLVATLASRAPGSTSRPILRAVAELLAALSRAGARHPDLNMRNVLIAHANAGEIRAMALDVDRVWFDTPGSRHVTERNVRRLARSARKVARRHDVRVEESDLQWLSMTAHDLAHPAV
jgi:3-deoxy-D-manno-octulosonic acid kinase